MRRIFLNFFEYENVEILPFFAVGFFLVWGTIFVETVSLLYVFIDGLATSTLDQIRWNMVGLTLLVACLFITVGLYLIHASKRRTPRKARSIRHKKHYFFMTSVIVGVALLAIGLISGAILLAIKFWPALPQ